MGYPFHQKCRQCLGRGAVLFGRHEHEFDSFDSPGPGGLAWTSGAAQRADRARFLLWRAGILLVAVVRVAAHVVSCRASDTGCPDQVRVGGVTGRDGVVGSY
ncbi:MAG: hypothetical protein WCE78_07340 [Pseudonocardiaceae bacterium]